MTCKDCIHEEICDLKRNHYCLGMCMGKRDDVEEVCQHFKNKIDFMKVVRCKDCAMCYINSYGKATRLGRCNSDVGLGKTVTFDDFCSYGERRDD